MKSVTKLFKAIKYTYYKPSIRDMIYFEEATEMGFNVKHQNAGDKKV